MAIHMLARISKQFRLTFPFGGLEFDARLRGISFPKLAVFALLVHHLGIYNEPAVMTLATCLIIMSTHEEKHSG